MSHLYHARHPLAAMAIAEVQSKYPGLNMRTTLYFAVGELEQAQRRAAFKFGGDVVFAVLGAVTDRPDITEKHANDAVQDLYSGAEISEAIEQLNRMIEDLEQHS